jgi:hypothetical protein
MQNDRAAASQLRRCPINGNQDGGIAGFGGSDLRPCAVHRRDQSN